MQQEVKELLTYLQELIEHENLLKNNKKSKKKEKIERKASEEDEKKGKLKKVFPDDLEKTEKLIKNLKSKITKQESKFKSRVKFINFSFIGNLRIKSDLFDNFIMVLNERIVVKRE